GGGGGGRGRGGGGEGAGGRAGEDSGQEWSEGSGCFFRKRRIGASSGRARSVVIRRRAGSVGDRRLRSPTLPARRVTSRPPAVERAPPPGRGSPPPRGRAAPLGRASRARP